MMLQPGAESGNVVVVLKEEDHKTFSRKGHDLFVTHEVGMTEALCGMQFVLQHLDGRNLVLRNPPGRVIEPGMLLRVISASCLFCSCPLKLQSVFLFLSLSCILCIGLVLEI